MMALEAFSGRSDAVGRDPGGWRRFTQGSAQGSGPAVVAKWQP